MARDGLTVIEKAAILLQRFVDERTSSLGFNAILAQSTLSKATAHRLLADLTKHGFLSQTTQGSEYRLGPLLLAAGILAQEGAGVRDAALPVMESLRDQFGETVVLSELHGNSVVPVVRLDGLHEMRMTQQLGRQYPAYAGATGQTLLANLPADQLKERLKDVDLRPLTSATFVKRRELQRVLKTFRTLGVGVSRGQRVDEAVAVAAPVFNKDGQLAVALTISGVASRWNRERLIECALVVRRATESVSGLLGHAGALTEVSALADLEDPKAQARGELEALVDEVWERPVRA